MKRSRNFIHTALIGLLLIDAILFALGAMARLGLSIPWEESGNNEAVIAQSMGVFLLVAVLAGIWIEKKWVGWLSWVALIFNFVGILIGMLTVASGAAIQTKPTAYLTVGMVFITTGALVIRAWWSPDFIEEC